MPKQRVFSLMSLFVAVVALVACAGETAQPSRIDRILATTSFGMCAGYCITQLEITPATAVLERLPGGRGGNSVPPQRFELKLSAAEWQEIARLADPASFNGLPDVIGCPDCADGGAESIEIFGPGVRKSVKFDHGANVPQLQPLLDRVRALRMQLTPKQ